MDIKGGSLKCSADGCYNTVSDKAQILWQKANKAGWEGFDFPICEAHIRDKLHRKRLAELGVKADVARNMSKAERDQRRIEAVTLALAKADTLITRKEASIIFGIRPGGISALAHAGYLEAENGLNQRAMYLTKKSCEKFTKDFLTSKITDTDLEVLGPLDRSRLKENQINLVRALQNGAFE